MATINVGNGKGTIAMGSGLTASDVYLQADESGNLSVDIAGDPSDSIVVNGDLTYNGSVSSAISAITFADGSSIILTQRPLTFTWFGASNNYDLSGNTNWSGHQHLRYYARQRLDHVRQNCRGRRGQRR